jgi:hypothetical protein
MLRLGLAAFFTAFAAPVCADDWVRLDDDGIRAALAGRTLVYEGGSTQSFAAGGSTTYDGTSGSWQVEGGRYCSVWPPSDRWACYDVSRDGARIRFSDGGSDTIGAYAD